MSTPNRAVDTGIGCGSFFVAYLGVYGLAGVLSAAFGWADAAGRLPEATGPIGLVAGLVCFVIVVAALGSRRGTETDSWAWRGRVVGVGCLGWFILLCGAAVVIPNVAAVARGAHSPPAVSPPAPAVPPPGGAGAP